MKMKKDEKRHTTIVLRRFSTVPKIKSGWEDWDVIDGALCD